MISVEWEIGSEVDLGRSRAVASMADEEEERRETAWRIWVVVVRRTIVRNGL